MKRCEICGYPVISGMHTCPNCQAVMPDDILPSPVPAFDSPEEEYEIPVCSLRPLARMGEREMDATLYDEGEEVMLARQNTVPMDRSIDDELQACLFYSDGHWFIEDRSVDNSTYVHAGAGIKLEPGDIIRMGEREFEFNIETRNDE